MNIKVPKLKCNQCEHIWTPRQQTVRICPKCKTTYWNEKKKITKTKKEKIS